MKPRLQKHSKNLDDPKLLNSNAYYEARKRWRNCLANAACMDTPDDKNDGSLRTTDGQNILWA